MRLDGEASTGGNPLQRTHQDLARRSCRARAVQNLHWVWRIDPAPSAEAPIFLPAPRNGLIKARRGLQDFKLPCADGVEWIDRGVLAAAQDGTGKRYMWPGSNKGAAGEAAPALIGHAPIVAGEPCVEPRDDLITIAIRVARGGAAETPCLEPRRA